MTGSLWKLIYQTWTFPSLFYLFNFIFSEFCYIFKLFFCRFWNLYLRLHVFKELKNPELIFKAYRSCYFFINTGSFVKEKAIIGSLTVLKIMINHLSMTGWKFHMTDSNFLQQIIHILNLSTNFTMFHCL